MVMSVAEQCGQLRTICGIVIVPFLLHCHITAMVAIPH
jgi:hypothetical protein